MSITESQTEDLSQDSVMNARLTWLGRMNSLTSLIFGTRDITMESMVFWNKVVRRTSSVTRRATRGTLQVLSIVQRPVSKGVIMNI